MKTYKVNWSSSRFTGSITYIVVAENLTKAKLLWEKFIMDNEDLKYSWQKAKNAGHISWIPMGRTGRAKGCYEQAVKRPKVEFWVAEN